MLVSTFDKAFSEKSTQIEVFNEIKHYVPAVLEGYNCTVFAYGQTGSGKISIHYLGIFVHWIRRC